MQNSHSPLLMNLTAMQLLQAAAEFVGGDKQLAVHLGIAPSLLGKLMAGRYPVPESLRLQVVDIVLTHRESLGGDLSQ
jgi:hypothetical protein